MKSFLIRCLLFLSIQVAIGYVLISKGMEPAEEQNAYLATILDKKELLSEPSEKPRLIVVGGSNVAFGFDTQELAGYLDLKPVNFGLHAALGLFFPLNCLQENVAEGDVIVLAFEYEIIASTTIDGNPKYLDEVFGYWPAARKYAYDEFDWKRFVDCEALDLVHFWADRGRRRLKGDNPDVGKRIYQRGHFNNVGDMTGHHGLPSPGFVPVVSLTLDPDTLQRSINRLNRFHDHCVQVGATVYYSFPPLPEDYAEKHKDRFRELEAELRDRLAMKVINSPAEMAFPAKDFYDTRYHLDQQAAKIRSKRVLIGIERETRTARLPTVPDTIYR